MFILSDPFLTCGCSFLMRVYVSVSGCEHQATDLNSYDQFLFVLGLGKNGFHVSSYSYNLMSDVSVNVSFMQWDRFWYPMKG